MRIICKSYSTLSMNTNKYLVRRAQINDLPALMAIYNQAIEESTAVYEYQPFDESYMKQWWKQKDEGNWPVLVFEWDQKIAAFGTYGTFRARAAYESCVEHSLYVHPQFQGQGLGKDMLIRLMDAARMDGRHTMIGGIDSTNSVSLKLHADLGFKEVGRLPEVAYKFDKWLDLVFMQLIL